MATFAAKNTTMVLFSKFAKKLSFIPSIQQHAFNNWIQTDDFGNRIFCFKEEFFKKNNYSQGAIFDIIENMNVLGHQVQTNYLQI